MKTVKLQINARGAWRDVLEFDHLQQRPVMEAVTSLAQALATAPIGTSAPTFRIVKVPSRRSGGVIAHLEQKPNAARITEWRWRWTS